MLKSDRKKLSLTEIEKIKTKSESVAKILKTIGHPKRLSILCYLSMQEYNVQELEQNCGLGQSLLSQYLKRMELESLINSRRQGKFIYYSIKSPEIKKLVKQLYLIFCID